MKENGINQQKLCQKFAILVWVQKNAWGPFEIETCATFIYISGLLLLILIKQGIKKFFLGHESYKNGKTS